MVSNRFFFFFLEIWPQEFYFVTGLLILAALGVVSRDIHRRPHVVRICVSADRVDRSDDNDRAVLAGRSKCRASGSTRSHGRRQDLEEGDDTPVLALIGLPPVARSCSISATRRRSRGTVRPARRPQSPTSSSRSSPRRLPARRHRARAGVHLHVPMATHPGRDDRPSTRSSSPTATERGEPRGPARKGQMAMSTGDAAIASIARPASPFARLASTSATARNSSASNARCASMPATRSWTRSGGRTNLIAYDTVAGMRRNRASRRTLNILRRDPHLRGAVHVRQRHHAVGLAFPRDPRGERAARSQPALRAADDGGVRNGYTVEVLNKLHQPRTFEVSVRGLAMANVVVAGAQPRFEVVTDTLRELRLFVAVPRRASAMAGKSVPVEIVVRDIGSGRHRHATHEFPDVPSSGG